MPAPDPILDVSTVDFDSIVADSAKIRSLIPQRHEMDQLTAVVSDDAESGIVIGYKDLTPDEFWIRGHMPGMPLMPGVLMCEAAAQLCSYHIMANRLMEAEMLGFGGLDEVRFREPVRPGDRLVIIAERLKLRPKTLVQCRFQCFVETSLVCHGEIRGIPIPVDSLRDNR